MLITHISVRSSKCGVCALGNPSSMPTTVPVQCVGDQFWFATYRLSACDLPLTSDRALAEVPGDGAH